MGKYRDVKREIAFILIQAAVRSMTHKELLRIHELLAILEPYEETSGTTDLKILVQRKLKG